MTGGGFIRLAVPDQAINPDKADILTNHMNIFPVPRNEERKVTAPHSEVQSSAKKGTPFLFVLAKDFGAIPVFAIYQSTRVAVYMQPTKTTNATTMTISGCDVVKRRRDLYFSSNQD